MANNQLSEAQITGQLVIEAEEIIRKYFGTSGDDDQEKRGKTQLSNAIDVIKQSDSIELFINWVRYQMAREKSGEEFWTTPLEHSRPKVEDMFGSAIIRRANQFRQENTEHEKAIAQLANFLGFLRRAFLARKFLSIVDLSKVGGQS